MPFGTSSAPEVGQCHMHEVIEGLQGIEVVVDDFVAVGHAYKEAICDHDVHLEAFLQHCGEIVNLKLRMQ